VILVIIIIDQRHQKCGTPPLKQQLIAAAAPLAARCMVRAEGV